MIKLYTQDLGILLNASITLNEKKKTRKQMLKFS